VNKIFGNKVLKLLAKEKKQWEMIKKMYLKILS